MSTTNDASYSSTKQQSIDLRLDAIDRALLGLLPRHDRLEVVAQIGAKIRTSAAATSQEENVECGSADLANSSLHEAIESAGFSAAVRPSRPVARRKYLARCRPRSRLAVSSGVLGIVALALLLALPVVYFVAVMSGDEWLSISLLGGHLAAVAFSGLLAVVLGGAALVVLNRREERLVGHGWAITGLCIGPLPMVVGCLVALVVGIQLFSAITAAPIFSASNIAPPAPLAMAPGYNDVMSCAPASTYLSPPSSQPPAPLEGAPYQTTPVFLPSVEAAVPQPSNAPQPESEAVVAPVTKAEAASATSTPIYEASNQATSVLPQ